MNKPWSVTTTMRNPERLVGFLSVLNELDGAEWDSETQMRYQIMLIQNREYGYGESQFYSGLPQEFVDIIDDASVAISFETAKAAFDAKNYNDPPMRGRQSLNPLKKLGFAVIKDDRIKVTELGKMLVSGQIDMSDAFLRCFLKWQLPNPANVDYSDADGYNVNPFVATLHLINTVNRKETERGNKAKGLSKREFALFVPSLINYVDIDNYANKILHFRALQKGLGKQERKQVRDAYRQEFASEFLETNDQSKIDKLLNNLNDYGDNAIRYFRLTRYFIIRGGGYYIDIEPRRFVEVAAIFENYTGAATHFESAEAYIDYISDFRVEILPWETRERQIAIAQHIILENGKYEEQLGLPYSETPSLDSLSNSSIAELIAELRNKRTDLQTQVNRAEAHTNSKLEEYIYQLEHIFDYEDKPIRLERLAFLGLSALNDAISIMPNYPVGDDNEPTFTAPGGVPDIECRYSNFNAICEVTMLTDRKQWYNEGQPVMRHLRDFENKMSVSPSYCLFISPKIHRDTLNTFWIANKYEYEGRKQRIIPMTITQFVAILRALLVSRQNERVFCCSDLLSLFDSLMDAKNVADNSDEWINECTVRLDTWVDKIRKPRYIR